MFHPCPQSASQRVSSFARSLPSRSFETIVLTSTCCKVVDKRRRSSARALVYDFRCPRFLISLSSLMVNPLRLLLYCGMSVLLALWKKIDCVFASVPCGETAIAGFLLWKFFGIPLVVDIRDLYPVPEVEFPFLKVHPPALLNRLITKIFAFLYRSSKKIVCVDTNIKQKVTELGVSEKKIVVIPNGADTSVYRPSNFESRRETRLMYELPEKKLIFVYAGALTGWYPLTSIYGGLKQPFQERGDFQLLVITFTKYDIYLEEIQRLGLRDVVRFMGPLSVSETARVLSACDVGVVVYSGTDYWKTMYGGKIFSYMACGLPVMAFGPKGSVINDLLSKHKAGVFVGEPSEQNFVSGILHFLDNKQESKAMGRNARETVERFYDRRMFGLKLVSLIEEVLEARHRVV